MAWIYFQALEDSPKPWKATSGRLPTAKTTDTLKEYCYPAWLGAICHTHPFGPTLPPCELKNYRNQSISSMEDFPVKTLALQDAERAWKESEAAYFSRSQGSLARYDPPSCSWRTYQQSLFEAQSELLESFAAYGMTVDGEFYPLQTWARITDEIDGGYWRTPDTGAGGTSGLLKEGKTHRKSGAAITVRLVDQVNNPRMWPTPRANDAEKRGNFDLLNPRNGLPAAAKMWPTPRATEWKDARPSHKSKSKGKLYEGLSGAVKMWPTPTSRDWKGMQANEYKQMRGEETEFKMASLPGAVGGGQLNPTWVEWLQGYHSGWTVLEPWAIAWFRPKHVKRLKD